jgi:phage terminase small subunit
MNRYRQRPLEPKSNRPIGNPPRWLTREEHRVWKELVKQSLPGVLLESDRTLFALLVRLATKLQSGDVMRGTDMTTLITLGSKFAMNPADRSRVVVDKPKDSTLDKFLSRRNQQPQLGEPAPQSETIQ